MMNHNNPQAKFKLYYWALPFRGCFVSYLFAYQAVPLLMETSYEEINKLRQLDPEDQEIPFIGPPILSDLEANITISQMPAIVVYASQKLGLCPSDPVELSMRLKVIMDCNDLLMEICRYNGSMMWKRENWLEFRNNRLPKWMKLFEESLNRKLVGSVQVDFADIGIYALFGNMIRCLPELEMDLLINAPGIHAHCRRIGSKPSLANFVANEELEYGNLYCGGQIEQSIREMLALDTAAA
ncbi:MAG: glutathione S-transferase family protein [Pseudomonadales bacterium]|nr:glutathione S-transferase family protein [Pseudomonadales bacterium]